MKTLYRILKTAVWCSVGTFLGTTLYRCCDYAAHPTLYEFCSAPWYTSIQVSGIFTALTVAVLLAAMYFIKKRMGKP